VGLVDLKVITHVTPNPKIVIQERGILLNPQRLPKKGLPSVDSTIQRYTRQL
jgi:hypothetical protein